MPTDWKRDYLLRTARDGGVIDRGECMRVDPDDEPDLPPFMRRSMREQVLHLVVRDDGVRASVETFFDRYQASFRDLRACHAMNRLNGLMQLGVKRNPAMDAFVGLPGRGAVRVRTEPYVHDRSTHSRLVASHMVALCLLLRRPPEDAATAAFGALLHDVGHCAYSHDGDELLVARGRPHHEERGQRLVRTDPDIAESLAKASVDAEAVIRVMREEGALGAMQKIMDTLAYVALDAAMDGQPLPDDFGTRVIASIVGVNETAVAVTDPSPLQDVLDVRTRLSQRIYYSPRNRLGAGLLQKALGALLDADFLTLEEIENGTDGSIEMELSFLMNGRRRPPEWIRSAHVVANGIWEEFDAHWDAFVFPGRAPAEAWLASLPPPRATASLLLPPYDFTKKTLRVRLPDGSEATLKAADIRQDVDRQWIACAYRA